MTFLVEPLGFGVVPVAGVGLKPWSPPAPPGGHGFFLVAVAGSAPKVLESIPKVTASTLIELGLLLCVVVRLLTGPARSGVVPEPWGKAWAFRAELEA